MQTLPEADDNIDRPNVLADNHDVDEAGSRRAWKSVSSVQALLTSKLRRDAKPGPSADADVLFGSYVLAKVLHELGNFFALSLDIVVETLRRPFPWREFLIQSWFVARVSILPCIVLSIPMNAFNIFLFNVLLIGIGGGEFSGSIAAITCVAQLAPIITVLVIAGVGATAVCADLGARTIREELDAMRVMGVDPVRTLLVPRFAALTLNALVLIGIADVVGVAADYVFSVYIQHVPPGGFAASLTLIAGLRQVVLGIVKAVAFGAAAAFIACYKGVTVSGGPAGVGNAVNETVVLSFIALFIINTALTAVDAQGVIAA